MVIRLTKTTEASKDFHTTSGVNDPGYKTLL